MPNAPGALVRAQVLLNEEVNAAFSDFTCCTGVKGNARDKGCRYSVNVGLMYLPAMLDNLRDWMQSRGMRIPNGENNFCDSIPWRGR